MTDLDDLKHRIRIEWAKLDHDVIAAAVRQWRRRLLVSDNQWLIEYCSMPASDAGLNKHSKMIKNVEGDDKKIKHI